TSGSAVTRSPPSGRSAGIDGRARPCVRSIYIGLLLAAAEGVHVDGQRLDRGVVEPTVPGRHYPAAAVPQPLDNGRLVGTVEPHRVGQVGRAHGAAAVSVGAVTGGAGRGENLLSGDQIGALVGRQPGGGTHVIRHHVDLGALEHAVAAERRHRHRRAALVVAGAHAVADGERDVVELAAPQPVVVVEIGIALGAAAAGAVAGGAIVG